MAKMKQTLMSSGIVETTPKKTRKRLGKHSKLRATSRNKARKRYRGQGR